MNPTKDRLTLFCVSPVVLIVALSYACDLPADLQKQYANDKDFLAASKQWLLANQSTLKINPVYSPFALDLERRKFFKQPKSDERQTSLPYSH